MYSDTVYIAICSGTIHYIYDVHCMLCTLYVVYTVYTFIVALFIININTLSLVLNSIGIDKEMYGFCKKHTWINSIVIVSAKKLEINLLVQLH